MIKTKFVFAVSLVAMLAVGSAWAYDPADTSSTADTVATEHTVYTDQTPTTGTGIAGVSYVNKAVNKAGASAQAAEDHAAAAGKSALAAADSAAQAATSAKKANDALAGKQDKLGFTPENVANKVTSVTSASTNTQYPSAQAVYQYVSGEMTTLNGNNSKLSGRVESLESAVTAEGALQDVVGNADSGLVKDVADLKTNKEAIANKLTSTAATTVSDTNKDTLYPTVGKVQSMINALDVTDAAQTGKYVSAVSEADGKIKVTRATLPTVNDATLTIKKNGTSVGTFTANASAAKEIDIKVPTKVSELTNDSSYATTGAMTTELNKKEATANKLTSTASTVISDTNKDTLYPSVGKVQLMVNERQMKSTAMSLGTTNGGWINLTDDATTGWVTSKCNQDGVTCSLVSKNGSIKWEKVTY